MMHIYDHGRPPASECNDTIISAQLSKANRPGYAHFIHNIRRDVPTEFLETCKLKV